TRAQQALRESEEALKAMNNELEARVKHRTAALAHANDELCHEINERNRLERELLAVSEREQRRMGQDLHDGVCQELTGVAFMARVRAQRLAKQQMNEAGDIVRRAEC